MDALLAAGRLICAATDALASVASTPTPLPHWPGGSIGAPEAAPAHPDHHASRTWTAASNSSTLITASARGPVGSGGP